MLGVRSRMPYNGVNYACHKRGQDHHSKGHGWCKLTLSIAYSQRPSTVGQQNFIPVLPTCHPSSCSTMSTSEELGSLLATLHMTYIYNYNYIIYIYKDIDWHIVSWNMKRDYCIIVWLLDVIVYYYFCNTFVVLSLLCVLSFVVWTYGDWWLGQIHTSHSERWTKSPSQTRSACSLVDLKLAWYIRSVELEFPVFPLKIEWFFCWPRIVQFFQSHWLHP